MTSGLSHFGRKSDAVLIRLSVEERKIITKKATSCALSVSEYMRRCALDEPLSTHVDKEALSELRRQGGLIKHLATSDRQHAYEYRVALNLIHDSIRRLIRASEGPQEAHRR